MSGAGGSHAIGTHDDVAELVKRGRPVNDVSTVANIPRPVREHWSARHLVHPTIVPLHGRCISMAPYAGAGHREPSQCRVAIAGPAKALIRCSTASNACRRGRPWRG